MKSRSWACRRRRTWWRALPSRSRKTPPRKILKQSRRNWKRLAPRFQSSKQSYLFILRIRGSKRSPGFHFLLDKGRGCRLAYGYATNCRTDLHRTSRLQWVACRRFCIRSLPGCWSEYCIVDPFQSRANRDNPILCCTKLESVPIRGFPFGVSLTILLSSRCQSGCTRQDLAKFFVSFNS